MDPISIFFTRSEPSVLFNNFLKETPYTLCDRFAGAMRHELLRHRIPSVEAKYVTWLPKGLSRMHQRGLPDVNYISPLGRGDHIVAG